MEQQKIPVSAIILTFNEEKNLPECLASIAGWVDEIFVVDSGSTDATVQIAEKQGVQIIYHPFEDYSKQRNWTLDNLPIRNNWVLQLDADHRVTPELRDTLFKTFQTNTPDVVAGFLVSRRTLFMDKWIRWGGFYPVYHAILFQRNKGRCEEKLYDQHFKVNGPVKKLKGDILNVVSDSLARFTERHNKWSTMEAQDQMDQSYRRRETVIQGKALGTPIEQRRYVKSLYERFPLFVRPCIYFFVRYFIQLGFLDGRRGLIYHFLQGFWFRFLVDAKIFELRYLQKKARP